MPTTQADNYANQIDEHGYVVIEGAVSAGLVTELRAALDAIEREHGLGYAGSRFEGYNTVRIYNLLGLRRTVLAGAAACRGVTRRRARARSRTAAVVAVRHHARPRPGRPAAARGHAADPLARPRPPIALNAMWALSDFTEANGATRIIPGSHRYDGAPPYGAELPTVAAEMPAGSVMLFDSQLLARRRLEHHRPAPLRHLLLLLRRLDAPAGKPVAGRARRTRRAHAAPPAGTDGYGCGAANTGTSTTAIR
ncbi:MAG: phytanoyl-CoA dioxygenase family protein [Proteobacteria bacterium]|nr:phytanoyl-CoA dioxygenase family protein [Pseudomonadota bacterium]